MSTKIALPRAKQQQQSTRSEAVPPPVADDVRELAWVQLTILDYITAHSDGTTELVDECKPRLEAILRKP